MSSANGHSPNIEMLRRVPLFRDRDDLSLQGILQAEENRIVSFEPGARILREGELAHSMFIILEGSVEVRIQAIHGREIGIGQLGSGDFFGEQALMTGNGGTRNAGIRAMTPVRLFEIRQERGSRKKTPADKAPPFAEDDTLLRLKNTRLLQGLNEDVLLRLTHHLEIRYYEPHQLILDRSSPRDFVHILLKGEAELLRLNGNGQEIPCAVLGTGRHFDQDILYSAESPQGEACIRAINAVLLGKLPKPILNPDTLPGILTASSSGQAGPRPHSEAC